MRESDLNLFTFLVVGGCVGACAHSEMGESFGISDNEVNLERSVTHALHSDVHNEAGVGFELAASGVSSESHSSASSQRAGNMPTEISDSKIRELNDAPPYFAPYEINEGGRSDDGSFVPYSVILPDTRTPVLITRGFPERAIAQVLFRPFGSNGKARCTGAMIAPDVLLTAGHCVHRGTADGGWHSDFEVFPGRNVNQQPYGSCSAVELYSVDGWTSANTAQEARDYDLGAIRLNCNVGEQTGYFEMSVMPDPPSGTVSQINGYPADLTPAGRQWTSVDEIREFSSLKLFYQNDTFGGMSGSPVFVNGEKIIIGVHTNGLHNGEPWSSNNAATRLTRSRISAINEWIGE